MDSNSKAIFICKFQTNDWVKGNKYLISHMSIKDCVVVNKFRNYNVRFFFGDPLFDYLLVLNISK